MHFIYHIWEEQEGELEFHQSVDFQLSKRKCYGGEFTLKDPLTHHVKIESKLGSGAFATVYEVAVNDQRYALKVSDNEHWHKHTLAQECFITQQLSHDFFAPALAVSTTRTPYCLFPLVEGKSLDNTNPTKEEKVNLLRSITMGLKELEQKEIYWLDLKPQNIMVDKTAKIIDAGAALNAEQAKLNFPLRATPVYMAPEIARENSLKFVDKYSLGVIAYELFTGNIAAKKIATKEVQEYAKTTDERLSMTTKEKKEVGTFATTLEKMGAREGRQRPNLDDFLEALDHIPL